MGNLEEFFEEYLHFYTYLDPIYKGVDCVKLINKYKNNNSVIKDLKCELLEGIYIFRYDEYKFYLLQFSKLITKPQLLMPILV